MAKETNTVKNWMTGRYSSLKTRRPTASKNERLQVVFWKKKNIVLTEIWCLKQILVAVPVKKTTAIWKKINAISSPKGQLFWKSPLQMPTIAFLKDLRYLIKSYNCCCEILKLTCSPWNKEITASSFVHFKSRMAFLK